MPPRSRPSRSSIRHLGAALPLVGPETWAPEHANPARPDDWLAWPEWGEVAPAVLLLAGAAWLYALGASRFYRRGEAARIPHRQWLAMTGALAVTFAAVVWPLDRAASALFAAHMAQHLALMLIVAPLLVLAQPHRVVVWALPLTGRRYLGRALARLGRGLEALPPAATLGLYALVLWAWHVPPAYDAAEANALLHGAEHLTMVSAAGLFWARIARLAGGNAVAQWRAIPFLIAGMFLGLTLGLGLTWAPQSWYDAHLLTAPTWGVTPREDQQLGGLLMLLPATALHLGILGLLLARAASRPAHTPHPVAPRPARPG